MTTPPPGHPGPPSVLSMYARHFGLALFAAGFILYEWKGARRIEVEAPGKTYASSDETDPERKMRPVPPLDEWKRHQRAQDEGRLSRERAFAQDIEAQLKNSIIQTRSSRPDQQPFLNQEVKK